MAVDRSKIQSIQQKPPIFIIGCQRSGTSFLFKVLGEILDIGFGRDNTLFLQFYNDLGNYGDLHDDENLQRLLNDIASSPVFSKRFKKLPINRKDFLSCLTDREYPAIVRNIYAYWAQEIGKSRWGGKTPDYSGRLTQLQQLFPDVRIIHIVRDGRDVALSLYGQPWGPKDAYLAAYYWKQRVILGSSEKTTVGDTFLEITYEDLLGTPEKTFQQILDFLRFSDIDPHQKMAEFKEKIVPKIMQNNKIKWKSRLSRNEIRLFEIVAGDVLEKYGYEIVNKDYRAQTVKTGEMIYHHARNVILKLIKRNIFRYLSKLSFRYRY